MKFSSFSIEPWKPKKRAHESCFHSVIHTHENILDQAQFIKKANVLKGSGNSRSCDMVWRSAPTRPTHSSRTNSNSSANQKWQEVFYKRQTPNRRVPTRSGNGPWKWLIIFIVINDHCRPDCFNIETDERKNSHCEKSAHKFKKNPTSQRFHNLSPVEFNMTVCGRIDSCHGIKQCCLPSSVGADDGIDLALLDCEMNVLHCNQPTEFDGNSVGSKDAHCFALSIRGGINPFGFNRTAKINARPKIKNFQLFGESNTFP